MMTLLISHTDEPQIDLASRCFHGAIDYQNIFIATIASAVRRLFRLLILPQYYAITPLAITPAITPHC